MFQVSRRLTALSILTVAGALACAPANAGWQVNNGNSEFHFVTTKAGAAGSAAIQEVQTFKHIEGNVDDNGEITFSVELGSVDTGVALRDQRLKEMLFNVAANPKAAFSGKVDLNGIKHLAPGGSKDVDVTGQLTLAGQTKSSTVKLRIVALAGHGLLVETRGPILVNAADFGLQPGVEALRALMGLNVLSGTAPVTFSVALD